MKNGVELIADERIRQIEEEGWTAEHDSKYRDESLVKAAKCYIDADSTNRSYVPVTWPWGYEWWKPSGDRIRDLTKAGALIAAEIDRLQSKE